LTAAVFNLFILHVCLVADWIPILGALQEPEHLYLSVLSPLCIYVLTIVPDSLRKSTPEGLYFEDLELLTDAQLACIRAWLMETVKAFSTNLAEVR
jgi:hypothetical protein